MVGQIWEGYIMIIILYGGNGTRRCPISQILYPEKFVKLFHDKSLFQHMFKQNSKIYKSQFVGSNKEQYVLTLDQLAELDLPQHNTHMLESIGRNRAHPCDALNYFGTKEWDYVRIRQHSLYSVSYTHLTLPTKRIV